MKKMWIKKENIYHKPFYKQKLKMTLLAVILMGVIFFAYQIFYMSQLQFSTSPQTRISIDNQPLVSTAEIQINPRKTILRGIRLRDYSAYHSIQNGTFKCLKSHKEIPIERLNDDYCDCEDDGSDEPSTNACNNGKFYCKFQRRHLTGRGGEVYVQSSRINDGVCDCCDGSDEWLTLKDNQDLQIRCLNKCT